MKKWPLFLLALIFPFFTYSYSIVFVHIGNQIPAYLKDSISQANLFNPKAEIYVILNKTPLQEFASSFPQKNIHWIPCESLRPSSSHRIFLKKFTLDNKKNGFWNVTSERFFYLAELVSYYHLTDVFHLESDVMLYVDLSTLLPVFHKHYPKIAATFDNDDRCIAGFFYVANAKAINPLTAFMADNARKNLNDMQIIALYHKTYPKDILNLPIIFPEYCQDFALKSPSGHKTAKEGLYYNHFDCFESIFDAAAMGQYLGGIDPIHDPLAKKGFINESCLFNPSKMKYIWKKDELGRKVPFAKYKGTLYRINNLHIHSKRLFEFKSVS